jgi:hypothetical protein
MASSIGTMGYRTASWWHCLYVTTLSTFKNMTDFPLKDWKVTLSEIDLSHVCVVVFLFVCFFLAKIMLPMLKLHTNYGLLHILTYLMFFSSWIK